MRNKKKKLLALIIIMMVIVFAVSSAEVFFNGSINIADSDDLDVYFSKAIIDEEIKNEVIIDKKHISYETKKLKSPDEISELTYEVSNNSKQYDANINITCTTNKEELVNIVIEPSEIEIKSGERKSGKIKVNTKKYVVDEMVANIDCELNVEAIERDELGKGVKTCSYGESWDFDTVGEEEFAVPCDGEYKLEVWGAQGGNANTYYGGYGGYSVGNIDLYVNDKLYINVGGQGVSDTVIRNAVGGYNGGGNATYFTLDYCNYIASGGGATHIAIKSGLLSSFKLEDGTILKNNILIVAGGGGGAYYHTAGSEYCSNGGSGGGYLGSNDYNGNSDYLAATGGSQTEGGLAGSSGAPGSFGSGGSSTTYSSGGGGGFFGGGSAHHVGTAGGSGYIGNSRLNEKAMYCYNCSPSEDEDKDKKTITENVTAEEDAMPQKAKKGNGYAKITYIG